MVRAVLVLASDLPIGKDVISGALAASAALAGLILVFLGIVVSTYWAYPPGTTATALRPYKFIAGAILGVFAISLACAGLSLAWLDGSNGVEDAVYYAVLATFFVQLLAIFGVAIRVVYVVMLK